MQPNQPEFLPAAPPVQLPPDPAQQPMDSALRLVIVLMFVNLGLSVVLTALMLIFRNSVIDYQLAHMNIPPNVNPELLRNPLQTALWSRLAGVVVVSLLYVWRAYALRRGSRGAYVRLIWIGAVGLAGIVYLIVAGNYPVWMRVEQVLQGIVLISLLIAITRRPVRDRFAKQRYA